MFLESQYFLPSERYHHWVKNSELVSFVLFILYFKDIPAQSPRFYLQQEIYYHLYLFPCVCNVIFSPSMLLCYCFSFLIISFKQFDYDMPVQFLCITCAWVSLYFEFQVYSFNIFGQVGAIIHIFSTSHPVISPLDTPVIYIYLIT